MADRHIWDLVHLAHDPRREQGRRHKLGDIFALTICAVICGAEHWTHIEEFGQTNEEWFRSFLELPHGIPSHDTIGRLFAALDPDAFEQVFQTWVQALPSTQAGKHLAIDGKTLRRSFDRADKKAAIHMVSAWAVENRVCFGQVKVDDKSNEITAIPVLLKRLCLKDVTITIDAMGCQRKIASQINEQGGHWLFCLKENQGTLHDDVKLYLDDVLDQQRLKEVAVCETTGKGHGRIETRLCCVDKRVGWLNKRHRWPGLSYVAVVEATRTLNGETSHERRYFIGSQPDPDVEEVAQLIRNHWQVENSLHWQLDVSFGEDASRVRIGNAAENLSRVRRLALALLKKESTAKVGVKGKRLKAGWDRNYLIRVLTI
jgi:predicted transposase YbfD/YdcC